MYRCHPLTLAVQAAIRAGAVGQVKLIRTSFCYRTTRVADNVRFRADLAGGALMDVGCYCLEFLPTLRRRRADWRRVRTAHGAFVRVDDLVSGHLRFGNDVFATFTCGMAVQADNMAYVAATRLHRDSRPWKPPVRGAQYTMPAPSHRKWTGLPRTSHRCAQPAPPAADVRGGCGRRSVLAWRRTTSPARSWTAGPFAFRPPRRWGTCVCSMSCGDKLDSRTDDHRWNEPRRSRRETQRTRRRGRKGRDER